MLRKTQKTKDSFLTEEVVIKRTFLAICNFEQGGRAVREGVAACRKRTIKFAGRIDA